MLKRRPFSQPPERDRTAEREASVRALMATPAAEQRGVMRRADVPRAPSLFASVPAVQRRTGSAVDGKHAPTKHEREWMGRVAALGCVVCRLMGFGPTPAQVHHTREGQGGAQRAGNYLTLPLCPDHHTGPTGVHGDKSCLRLLKVTELDLLDLTISEVITAKGA
jgi:hypothetical protein